MDEELETLEDRLDANEAERALAEFEASGEKSIPAEEVFEELEDVGKGNDGL